MLGMSSCFAGGVAGVWGFRAVNLSNLIPVQPKPELRLHSQHLDSFLVGVGMPMVCLVTFCVYGIHQQDVKKPAWFGGCAVWWAQDWISAVSGWFSPACFIMLWSPMSFIKSPDTPVSYHHKWNNFVKHCTDKNNDLVTLWDLLKNEKCVINKIDDYYYYY